MTITLFGRRSGRRSDDRRASLARLVKRKRGADAGLPAEAAIDGPPPPPPGALRLMSLNIAHARRKSQHQSLLSEPTIRQNLSLIASVIEREQPHVVALQEADGPSAWSGKIDHVETISGLAGLPHAFRGHHAHPSLARLDLSYGTALLSRLPLEGPRSHAFLQTWRDSKGFVAATIKPEALGGESLDVVSIHLDFLTARVRRRQVEQLVDRFRGHAHHLVVMGDFNCSWSERRQSLDLLHRELKLRPFPALASPTYPAWRPLVRLDWILVSEGLDFAGYSTLRDRLSDHLGIVADIRRRVGRPRRGSGEGKDQPRRLPRVSLA